MSEATPGGNPTWPLTHPLATTREGLAVKATQQTHTRQQWTDRRYWEKPLVERVRARVAVVESGCWEWQGCLNSGGYGQVRMNGKAHYTHRVMFTDAKGEIPAGMHLDHLCRNRRCCNPDHLQAVTPRENTRRGTAPSAIISRSDRCLAGHDLRDAYVRSDTGARQCRECRRDRDREKAKG